MGRDFFPAKTYHATRPLGHRKDECRAFGKPWWRRFKAFDVVIGLDDGKIYLQCASCKTIWEIREIDNFHLDFKDIERKNMVFDARKMKKGDKR
jgi:hypothetical protein